jgi:hypothetical protein
MASSITSGREMIAKEQTHFVGGLEIFGAAVAQALVFGQQLAGLNAEQASWASTSLQEM